MSEEKVCQLIFDHEPSICCHSSQVMGLTCPCAGRRWPPRLPCLCTSTPGRPHRKTPACSNVPPPVYTPLMFLDILEDLLQLNLLYSLVFLDTWSLLGRATVPHPNTEASQAATLSNPRSLVPEQTLLTSVAP